MALKLPDSAVPMGDFPVARAVDIDFDDGENLQDKFDNGELGGGSSTPNESAGIELWVSGEIYEENDFVSYNDYIYRCVVANSDVDFVADNWVRQSDTHVEITEQEILDLLDLTDEELETMAQLIDDSVISLNKTYSSSKIYAIFDAIKNNCGENYSTDEQLTGGTWIDGKPIYRIYVTFPLFHLKPSEWNTVNSLSITGIDEIINARAKRSEDDAIIPLAARSRDTSIEVNSFVDFTISKLILEYTKR